VADAQQGVGRNESAVVIVKTDQGVPIKTVEVALLTNGLESVSEVECVDEEMDCGMDDMEDLL
jgi:hypothetical protein